MSKEELLKYLIAEIDLIMHDKDYRFENQNGTWYSRESCRNLTNEEVFEELKGELRQLADLEAKLAESEKSKESYRLQNDEHHLQLLQFYSRLGVEAFGADIHEKALETLMIMKEKLVEFEKVIEKYDCKSVKRLNGRLYRYDQYETKIFNMEEEIKGLKQQLAESEEFLVATKWKVQDLNKQLADTETQNKRVLEKLELIVSANQELEQKLAEKDKLLREKIGSLKTTDFIRLCLDCGFMVDAKDKDNQDKISFAVEQLEKVKENISSGLAFDIDVQMWFEEYIDNQIEAIKGEK